MRTILFIRHAQPDNSFLGPSDNTPISKKGITTHSYLLKLLKERHIKPNLIYSSPLLRAVQSAKILAQEWDLPIIEEPALGNHFDAKKITALITHAKDHSTIVFTGHAGEMEELIETLAAKPILPAGLSKSAAVIMNFSEDIKDESAKKVELINTSSLLK